MIAGRETFVGTAEVEACVYHHGPGSSERGSILLSAIGEAGQTVSVVIGVFTEDLNEGRSLAAVESEVTLDEGEYALRVTVAGPGQLLRAYAPGAGTLAITGSPGTTQQFVLAADLQGAAGTTPGTHTITVQADFAVAIDEAPACN